MLFIILKIHGIIRTYIENVVEVVIFHGKALAKQTDQSLPGSDDSKADY